MHGTADAAWIDRGRRCGRGDRCGERGRFGAWPAAPRPSRARPTVQAVRPTNHW